MNCVPCCHHHSALSVGMLWTRSNSTSRIAVRHRVRNILRLVWIPESLEIKIIWEINAIFLVCTRPLSFPWRTDWMISPFARWKWPVNYRRSFVCVWGKTRERTSSFVKHQGWRGFAKAECSPDVSTKIAATKSVNKRIRGRVKTYKNNRGNVGVWAVCIKVRLKLRQHITTSSWLPFTRIWWNSDCFLMKETLSSLHFSLFGWTLLSKDHWATLQSAIRCALLAPPFNNITHPTTSNVVMSSKYFQS